MIVQEDEDEKIRRVAFNEHAPRCESPDFWKNEIANRSKARKVEREMLQKRKQSFDDGEVMDFVKTKKTTPGRAPHRHRFQSKSLPTPPSTGGKSRKDHFIVQDDASLDFDQASDTESLFVNGSKNLNDPFLSSGEDHDEDEMARKKHKERSKHRRGVMNGPLR